MVIDSSILIAIAKKESGYEQYIRQLSESSEITMSATTLLETYIVLSYQPDEAWNEIQHLIDRSNVNIVEFSEQTMHSAIQAHIAPV